MKKFKLKLDALSIFTGLALAAISFYYLYGYYSKPSDLELARFKKTEHYLEEYCGESALPAFEEIDKNLEFAKQNTPFLEGLDKLEKKVQEIPSSVKESKDYGVYTPVLTSLKEDIEEIYNRNKKTPEELIAGGLVALTSGFFLFGAPYLFNTEEEIQTSYK